MNFLAALSSLNFVYKNHFLETIDTKKILFYKSQSRNVNVNEYNVRWVMFWFYYRGGDFVFN